MIKVKFRFVTLTHKSITYTYIIDFHKSNDIDFSRVDFISKALKRLANIGKMVIYEIFNFSLNNVLNVN